LLYLPFDGTPQAAVSGGPSHPSAADAGLAFRPGMRGQCVRLTADCRFPSSGNFNPKAGTIAFWVRPAWSGNDKTGHYFFSIYGSRQLKEPWLRNRWSLTAGQGQFQCWISASEPGQDVRLNAPIAAWQPNQWHHVAVTWANLSSGRADGELCLYIDGQCVGQRTGFRLDQGPIHDQIDIGRDSDGSPDYADAELDEFYLYAQALPAAAIKRAVSLAQKSAESIAAQPSASPSEASVSGWWNAAWPFRCQATVNPPRSKPSGGKLAVRLPWNVQDDLNALGVFGAIDPASIRVVPGAGQGGQADKPLAVSVEPDALVWQMPAGPASRWPQTVEVYFDIIRYDMSVPLFLQPQRWASASGPAAAVSLPDYATETYQDAWDFDEGDFEGLDGWGNGPDCLRNRQVKSGVLSMDVSEDPYFIWGDMWGSNRKSNRPMAIDLKAYPVLEMKIRQSCPSAEWEIYGRAGRPELMFHRFPVHGTGWQIVRVHLAKEARWGGVLDAFRIDPTSHVAKAHVEIDWIRLVNFTEALREPVEMLGPPSGKPERLTLDVQRTQALAGAKQKVAIRVTDAAGAPVAGQPITVRLSPESNGSLEASQQRSLALGSSGRRGLTDAEGRLEVVLSCSRKAGAKTDVVEAKADFASLEASRVAVDAIPGPPHHYTIQPSRSTTVDEKRFPRDIQVQLVDEFGNPLAVAGRRVTLEAPTGATLTPQNLVTDASGKAATNLRIDLNQRWVYAIKATDDQGCSGTSAAFSVTSSQGRANSIRLLPNGYFAHADGRPFVPLGGFYANWVQGETPNGEWTRLRSFTDTTDQDKRQWMKFLQESGVTAMRMMLRTHRPDGMEPMDVGGRVNQALFAEALRYMDLAREFGLQFQVVLHEDYEKPVYFNEKHLRQYALPALAGVNLDTLMPAQRRFLQDVNLLFPIQEKYHNKDAIACQDAYAREIVDSLRNNPQVFAYELENEMVNCPAPWANHAIEVIRQRDAKTPTCVSHGGGGLHTADPLWWHRNTRIDFYNYHLYPSGWPTTAEIDYGAAIDVLTRYGRMCGPSMLGESAGDEFSSHPSTDTRRLVMRDIIWLALTNGNPGVFFWNARGAEVREFKMARQAMAQLDLATFKRAKPEIGIDVTHPLDDDKWFRTPDGRKAYLMMGRYAQHYLSQGVAFDFTVEPSAYAKRAGLNEFAPPEPSQRPFRFNPGWQLNPLSREDGREMLVYVRNLAGIDKWECGKPPRRLQQYLRRRASAPLRLAFQLAEGSYDVQVYDLDEQKATTRAVSGTGSLDLGTTDHDFAMVIKRR
jgi:hypothetical protein